MVTKMVFNSEEGLEDSCRVLVCQKLTQTALLALKLADPRTRGGSWM